MLCMSPNQNFYFEFCVSFPPHAVRPSPPYFPGRPSGVPAARINRKDKGQTTVCLPFVVVSAIIFGSIVLWYCCHLFMVQLFCPGPYCMQLNQRCSTQISLSQLCQECLYLIINNRFHLVLFCHFHVLSVVKFPCV